MAPALDDSFREFYDTGKGNKQKSDGNQSSDDSFMTGDTSKVSKDTCKGFSEFFCDMCGSVYKKKY